MHTFLEMSIRWYQTSLKIVSLSVVKVTSPPTAVFMELFFIRASFMIWMFWLFCFLHQDEICDFSGIVAKVVDLRIWILSCFVHINSLRPRENGRHLTDDIFQCIFLNENIWILRKLPRATTNVQKNKSYVGLFISYVGLIKSYVGLFEKSPT